MKKLDFRSALKGEPIGFPGIGEPTMTMVSSLSIREEGSHEAQVEEGQ